MLIQNIRFLLNLLIGFIVFLLGNRVKPVTYKLIEENTMGLIYEISLPSASAFDVKSRVLTYTINGLTKDVVLLPNDISFILPTVSEGDIVELYLKEVDDVGNVSEPSDLVAFTAKDTIAPPKPGSLSVSLLREVPDELIEPPEVSPPVEDTAPVNVVKP